MSTVRKIDWASVASKLKPETSASINSFRARHAALQKQVADLKDQLQPLNFSHYESVIKNSSVVFEAKKSLSSFKPAAYPLEEQVKSIEASRTKAVSVS
jgi:hypothetical protein